MGLHRICSDVRFRGSYPRHDLRAPVTRPGTTNQDFAEAQAWLSGILGS